MIRLSCKDAIARVREAEQKADAIRANAEREAVARVEKTEKACADRTAKAVAVAEKELKTKLADVQKRADALIEQSREEARAEIGNTESDSRTRVRDAVKMIVWEMHNLCQ